MDRFHEILLRVIIKRSRPVLQFPLPKGILGFSHEDREIFGVIFGGYTMKLVRTSHRILAGVFIHVIFHSFQPEKFPLGQRFPDEISLLVFLL